MADTRDLLTLAEAKSRLRIDSGDVTRDEELAAYITAASRLIDEWAGPVVQFAVSGERHDGTARSGYDYARSIILAHRPVAAFGSIVEYSGGSSTTLTQISGETEPSDGFFAERHGPDPALYSGVVMRTHGPVRTAFAFGQNNIVCSYTAGRVASTTSVSAMFKQACGLVLKNLWREEEFSITDLDEYQVPRQSFPTFAMPNVVRQLLGDELGQNDVVSGGIA